MTDELKDQLGQLHQELADNPKIDAESAEMLRKIAADIELMELTDHGELTEGVQRLALDFEQDHPTLSEVLRQIVETLGRIGV